MPNIQWHTLHTDMINIYYSSQCQREAFLLLITRHAVGAKKQSTFHKNGNLLTAVDIQVL